MDLTWYEGLIYGFLSGITRLIPVSSEAHRQLFILFTGSNDSPLLRIGSHLGILLALIFSGLPILSRLHRESRIAAMPRGRRKRHPDTRSILEMRLLRVAILPVILLLFLNGYVAGIVERLWILAGVLLINGIILYVPQFLYRANKDAHTLSGLDAMLIGLGMGLGVVPGISGVGAAISIGSVRGADRRYILDMVLLLMIPTMIGWLVIDGIALAVAATVPVFWEVICSFLAAIASLAGASVALFTMRFLAVKTGFSGFAYYSWGFALLTFLLYLI